MNYGAITIGPIIDTLSIAASPGTLWCASTMFSRLAGDLCESICHEIPDAEIVAPAYEAGFVNSDGIGRFHDRIFFSCSLDREALARSLQTLCENAKAQLAGEIADALGEQDTSRREEIQRYMERYIQLSWLAAGKAEAEADGKNCILNLSQYLDCMELTAQNVPEETESPIMRLLCGTDESSNAYIYRKAHGNPVACWLIPENAEKNGFQLLKNGKVREISDIANPFDGKDGRKLWNYFAVVQSDGDNMGALLRACPPEHVRAFSKSCIDYAAAAAKRIGAYGGLTIYAGGDDLLFLAPMEGKNGANLFVLCEEITELFNSEFNKLASQLPNAKLTTISFGISINYKKAPLYEALEDARNLLFGSAKSGSKNQLALSLHKHSGQTIFLLLPNRSEAGTPVAGLCELISAASNLPAGKKDEALHSVLYQMEAFRSLFATGRSKRLNIQDLYDNLMDSPAHDLGRAYIDRIKAVGDIIAAQPSCRAGDGETGLTDDSISVLTSMLRLVRLYSERGNGE